MFKCKYQHFRYWQQKIRKLKFLKDTMYNDAKTIRDLAIKIYKASMEKIIKNYEGHK